MERKTFILRSYPGKRDRMETTLRDMASAMQNMAKRHGVENFSIWNVESMFYGYGEFYKDDVKSPEDDALCAQWEKALAKCGEMLCAPGTMRLMYHDIGVVRKDKNLIHHRVFSTRLKPGCEGEYKRRHDALIQARGDKISEGPDSNFTIWYGAGYIFGYCEKVNACDHVPTEEERQADIEWETRQLEIMDWLTDDVDWLTGQKHEKMKRIV